MNNEFISIMTERIVQGFDPLQIILFGSQARADSDQQSDIDLLVVFAEGTDDPFNPSDFHLDLQRPALFEKPIGSGCCIMLDLEVLLDSRFASFRDGGGRAPSDSESTGQYTLDEFKLSSQYFSIAEKYR